MMKLKHRVAIITGAASGMGREIALRFAREGARVVVTDLGQGPAQETLDEIRAAGGTGLAVSGDISKQADVDRLFAATLREFGGVDILVNNAGIMDAFVPVAELGDELWERVLAVNLGGPMRTMRAVLPIFGQRGGCIINVASIGGLQGSRAGAAYTASKHGLIGLSKNVAFQYAKAGVRCNVIAPGGVTTNIMAGQTPHPEGMAHAMAGVQANIRTGDPDEIAGVALFLASHDASLVNGAVIVADAGWTAY